jgi:hypothetical protein
MRLNWFLGMLLLVLCGTALGQSFELTDKQESLQSTISQTIRIPLKIKNTGEKAQFYVVRLAVNELSSTQKGYFCFEKTCLEPGIIEFSKRVEAGTTLEGLFFVVETGIVAGQFPVTFEVFAKGAYNTLEEYPVLVNIEEKASKTLVFQSKDIIINDVYPNPVNDVAYVDYRLHNDNIKAKLVVHNILGTAVNDLPMPQSETKIKLETTELTPGLYFYTIYLDNIGVITRKLIVRR